MRCGGRLKMKIYRNILLCFFVSCLFFTLPVYASNIYSQNNTALNSDISADLKVRKNNGNWQDGTLEAKVGETIEFKITVSVSRSYLFFGILVELPKVGDKPMLDYKSSNTNPMDANDEELRWYWLQIEPSWSEVITFTVQIKKSGTKTIKLTAFGEYKGTDNKLHEDSSTDSVSIYVKKGTGKHMPMTFLQNKVKLLDIITNLKEKKITFILLNIIRNCY